MVQAFQSDFTYPHLNQSCFAGPIFFYRDHSFASGHQVQWAPGDGECVGRVAMLADTRLAAGMG